MPLLCIPGKLRALGVDLALHFHRRDVGIGDLGPRGLADVRVKLVFLQVEFYGCAFLLNHVRCLTSEPVSERPSSLSFFSSPESSRG